MKERPILFSGEMVRAILDGKKNQTRRVVKDVPLHAGSVEENGYPGEWIYWKDAERSASFFCPYGVPGDRLWVKEAWRERGGTEKHIDYRSTPIIPRPNANWRPSIFMPRWASRLTLEIVSVRVERLQGISEEDAKAEGCEKTEIDQEFINEMPPRTIERDLALAMKGGFLTSKFNYQMLWDSINGKTYPWDSNPWVWVVEFKKERGQRGDLPP